VTTPTPRGRQSELQKWLLRKRPQRAIEALWHDGALLRERVTENEAWANGTFRPETVNLSELDRFVALALEGQDGHR
jgi:hypothetical protein